MGDGWRLLTKALVCGLAVAMLCTACRARREFDGAALDAAVRALEYRDAESALLALGDILSEPPGARVNAGLPPDVMVRIVDGLAPLLIVEDRIDALARLQTWLESAGPEHALYRSRASLLRADLLIARGHWDGALEAAPAALDRLDDAPAAGRVDPWIRLALRNAPADVADRLAGIILEKRARLPRTAVRAAAWRLYIPYTLGDSDKALARFEEFILEGGLPPAGFSTLIAVLSGLIIGEGRPEPARRFLELCDALPWDDMGDRERRRHSGTILDISFVAGDYARTEAIIREGIPGHDERWHAIMLNKALAHLAEEAGRTDEAVERFRRFMADMLEDHQDDLRDPASGRRVTGTMIQAINARRIGDILQNAGRAPEAAGAYAEAARHYAEALAESETDGPEAAWIQAEIESLPPPAP